MSTLKTNTIENVAGTESHDVATMGIENSIVLSVDRDNQGDQYVTKYPDGTMVVRGAIQLAHVMPAWEGVTPLLYTNYFTNGDLLTGNDDFISATPIVNLLDSLVSSRAASLCSTTIDTKGNMSNPYIVSTAPTPSTDTSSISWFYTTTGRWK